MLRVLRCMHFIHLLLSFSLLRARGLSTFARRFTASARTIDPSIDQFFFLSIAHSLPFLFFLSFFLSLSTLLFLLRWIILLNVRRFFSTLRSIHHLVSRDLKLSSLRVSFRNSFFLIRTISSPSFKITSLWYFVLIFSSPSFLPLSFSSSITCFDRREKQAYAWAGKSRLYSSYNLTRRRVDEKNIREEKDTTIDVYTSRRSRQFKGLEDFFSFFFFF